MERLTHLIEKAEPILQAGSPVEPSDPVHAPLPVTAEGGLPASTNPEETEDVRNQNG
jgi:hypothetical protein